MIEGYPVFGDICALCHQEKPSTVGYQMVDGGTIIVAICPECEVAYKEKLATRGFTKQVSHAS